MFSFCPHSVSLSLPWTLTFFPTSLPVSALFWLCHLILLCAWLCEHESRRGWLEAELWPGLCLGSDSLTFKAMWHNVLICVTNCWIVIALPGENLVLIYATIWNLVPLAENVQLCQKLRQQEGPNTPDTSFHLGAWFYYLNKIMRENKSHRSQALLSLRKSIK